MACTQIANDILATCEGVRKPGGVNRRVFVGYVEDIDSITFNATNGYSIDSFTMKSTKELFKFEGRKEKNSATSELQPGENVNLFNQSANLVLYWADAAELEILNNLANSEGLFVIVETNAGQLEVYGLTNSGSITGYGLATSAMTDNTGALINDSRGVNVSISGLVPVSKLIYNEDAADLATAIAELEAHLTPAP